MTSHGGEASAILLTIDVALKQKSISGEKFSFRFRCFFSFYKQVMSFPS